MADQQDIGGLGPGTPFVIVSANFGGAARQIALRGEGEPATRSEALGAFVGDPSGVGSLGTYPVVAGIQEVSKGDSATLGPVELVELIGPGHRGGQLFYAPTVSTAWYPQKAKWKSRWNENVCHAEQGMAVCSLREAALVDPEENIPHACRGERPPFKGMVLNLPVVKFRRPAEQEDASQQYDRASWESWISHSESEGVAPLQFRHTRYLGNRDTEPRIASAHRVRLKGSDPHGGFVFINAHLTTLREEDREGASSAEPLDGVLPRTQREPTREAEFLRHLQLSEICDFIWYVYTNEALRLPVIVAGDFNSTPDRPDLARFMAAARLKPVFRGDKCWGCGGAPLDFDKQVFSNERHKSVLTEDQRSFERLTGEPAKVILAREYCSSCNRPLFTHKRNFKLIDNILFTHGSPPNTRLRARIELDSAEAAAGIGVHTYFSDHFPIWGKFRLR